MDDWTNKGVPKVGVHRTASHYSQLDLPKPLYQHWNGRHWGQVGLTIDEALGFADMETSFSPLAWRAPQGEICT